MTRFCVQKITTVFVVTVLRNILKIHTCPTCADELTEETLTEPSRMVKDYLNESKIRCVYHDRACEEIVQLQHLDQHEVRADLHQLCVLTQAVVQL